MVDIKTKYKIHIFEQVQQLSLMRKKLHITQAQMAQYCGVSIKTIVNFENYKHYNHFLIFAYSNLLL